MEQHLNFNCTPSNREEASSKMAKKLSRYKWTSILTINLDVHRKQQLGEGRGIVLNKRGIVKSGTNIISQDLPCTNIIPQSLHPVLVPSAKQQLNVKIELWS